MKLHAPVVDSPLYAYEVPPMTDTTELDMVFGTNVTDSMYAYEVAPVVDSPLYAYEVPPMVSANTLGQNFATNKKCSLCVHEVLSMRTGLSLIYT
jgi:hypothetical protein